VRGPSRHLSWNELACWNRTTRVFTGFAPGEIIAVYPQVWRETRAVLLAETFEAIRVAVGNRPIMVNSGYRTPEYNRAIGGAHGSQHIVGRALDIRCAGVSASRLFAVIRTEYDEGRLPTLGGIGGYRTFVHIDIRPKVTGRLAVWHG
jgi:hypothetical protein